LAAGKSLKFEVEVVLFNSLKPYPTEITQAEKQYVLFKGNHYYYSIYQTVSQTTVVNLASDKTESYSQLKPTSKQDTAITYGPYENIKSYEQVREYILKLFCEKHAFIFQIFFKERIDSSL
jgi:oligosaccharyltransferase complex subunit alpha (ribophorin I)